MKKLLTLLLLSSLSVFAQSRTPLLRAFLQSNMDGNGFCITNLPCLNGVAVITFINGSTITNGFDFGTFIHATNGVGYGTTIFQQVVATNFTGDGSGLTNLPASTTGFTNGPVQLQARTYTNGINQTSLVQFNDAGGAEEGDFWYTEMVRTNDNVFSGFYQLSDSFEWSINDGSQNLFRMVTNGLVLTGLDYVGDGGRLTNIFATNIVGIISSNNLPYLTNSFGITIDGGGSEFTTGVKGYIQIPYACKIIGATMMGDQAGGCGINIWRTNSASYPPSSAGKISGDASPVLTADDMSQDTTLTGWTTGLNADDFVGFNVESNTTTTRVTLQLKVIHLP